MSKIKRFFFDVKVYVRHPGSLLLLLITRLAVAATVGVFALIIGYVFWRGVPYITPDLFALTYNSDNVSLMPALISTVVITAMTLLIAAPIGIFAAVYLVEYAKKESRVVKAIRITTETLAGIPSIIFGLFGLLFFVILFGRRMSILAGAFTLAIMVLPTIMRTTEEALLATPDAYREASFGLGAGKLRTIFRIILPAASPGIMAGVILAMGKIVGETAALIYTSGTVAQVPRSPLDSARTLAVHMYALSDAALHTNQAFATGVILIVLVVIINLASRALLKKVSGGNQA